MIAGKWSKVLTLLATMLIPSGAFAEVPWQFADNTRYMAMGDSLSAGYGAIPSTQGFAYLLYHDGTFDTIPNTLLSNVGVPGATSQDVLETQVPLAVGPYQPTVICLSVGGNDLLSILNGADPNVVLLNFQNNLFNILSELRTGLPDAKIFINNLYDMPEIPGATGVIQAFNFVLENVAGLFQVPVADVYSAFEGKQGLRLIQRNGANQFEVHPSNAGHREIAQAYKLVINED